MAEENKLWMDVVERFIGYYSVDSASDDVGFMRNLQRKEFKVMVSFRYSKTDRKMSLYSIRKKLEGFIRLNLHHQQEVGGPEIIAERILSWAETTLGPRKIRVSVHEAEGLGVTVENDR